MSEDEKQSVEAENVQYIANEALPKLVEILQDIGPEYRLRLIAAAKVLLNLGE